MLERIIFGLFLGFIYGLIGGPVMAPERTTTMWDHIASVIAIAFVGASCMFGPVFGVMAIGELYVGYLIGIKLRPAGASGKTAK